MNENTQPRIARRAVTAGLAWSVPTALAVAHAPLAAASPTPSGPCDRATAWRSWLDAGGFLLPEESLGFVTVEEPVFDEEGNQVGTRPHPYWEFTGAVGLRVDYVGGFGQETPDQPEEGVQPRRMRAEFGEEELSQVRAISFGGRERRYELDDVTCSVEPTEPCDVDRLWRENTAGVEWDRATGRLSRVVTLEQIQQAVSQAATEFTEIVALTGNLSATYLGNGEVEGTGTVPLTLDERGEAVLSFVGPAGVALLSAWMTVSITMAPSAVDPEQPTDFVYGFYLQLDPRECTLRRPGGGSS